MEKSNKSYIIEPIKEKLTYEECLKALLDKCLKDKEELKSQEYTVLKDKDIFMVIQSLSPFQLSVSSKSICNGKEVPFYKEYEFKEFNDVLDFLATQKQYYADKDNESLKEIKATNASLYLTEFINGNDINPNKFREKVKNTAAHTVLFTEKQLKEEISKVTKEERKPTHKI